MKKFILFFCAAFIATLGMFADTVTLTYTAGTTSNLTGENDAATLGLNDAEWSVVSDKNGNNNHVGINKDGTIRLYANNILTIANLKGKVITSVALDVNSGEGEVRVNNEVVEGVDNVYEIGAEEFVLTNPNSSQWRLKSITVTYETPGTPLVCTDVVDGGTYAIVNFQSTGAMYYLENVDGVLTAQNGEGIDGTTQWAQTCQFKAIALEDGRFAFQNVANGEYLAWRNHNGQGGNGNCGFNPEINEMSSWTMNDGTQVPDFRTYWFYVNNRSETNPNTGSLIIDNNGGWNGWGNTECTLAGYSNNYGFVAVPTEVDFTKVNISAINQADFVAAGKWYLLKQKRGGVSPTYDAGVGATMKRAANDNVVVAGMDAAEAVDYLLRFIPTENEGAYNLQFANGHYWASSMTTTEEEPGEYNVYNINGEAGHIGINLFEMDKIVDNNGAGNTLAFWDSGEVTELNGNNDWTVWEVEFAPKTTAAADLKELIKEVEAAYALNNVAELGENLITKTSQFSSPFTEPSEGDINALIDGDCSTFWHSAWSQGAADMHVHYLQVDLPEAISGDLQVTLGRRANNGGFCANDNVVLLGVEASADGETFTEVGQIPMPLVNGEWYECGVVAVENAKVFRFFNDESNGTNQRGYWHAGEFQLNLVTTPALNVSNAEAAAALLEAVAAAKACGANATDADVAALQAAFAAYEAALAGTPEPSACVATITAVFPNGNKHVVYSNGSKLTASAEAPADAIVKFEVVSREDNTIVLKAGDQYIHWTSGDNTGKSADLDGLNADLDESLNTLTMAPATLQGAYTSSEWGKTEADVAGLYRLMGHGTDGGLYDFTLRENDDAWIAGDAGMFFFDTNWDGNGCRTSFFEIEITEGGVEPAPVPVTFEFTDNEDGTITVTPSDLKAPYFFNIYSDRINTEYQQGTDAEAIANDVAQNLTAPETEVHTGVSVVNPAEWLNYWFGGYVQYTAGDYRLGVVALNWDGTYTMAGEPVFHAFTKAASEPVVDETYVLNFEKDLVQKSDDRHVTGFSLNDQTLTFPSYNTVYLDATDQVIEVNAGEALQPAIIWDGQWMHGIVYVDLDNDGSFYEEGDLVAHSPYTGNQNLATSISAFNAPAKAGEYRMRIKTDWVGDSQNMDGGGLDPAGRIGDDGTMTGNNSIWANRGRIVDVTLKVVGEETFPAEGVAYKFKNVDSELYITLVDDPDQDVTLGATPDQMFFTAVEGGWTISNSKGIVLGATAKGWNIGNSSDPIVWTIEEVEGGYAFHNEKGYLGFDSAAAGMKAFRDKNYTTHHGVFNIWKYDEEEPEPVIPDATLDEIWENIHSLLAEAEAIKTLNQVTVTYDRDGYFEDFTSPIVGKLGYKGHDVVWAVCDGADYVDSFVSYFSTAAEAQEYLEEWGGLAALQEIIQNVIDDYNAAEVVLPEAGKTYIVYSDPYTYGKAGYSYVLGNCVPQSGKGYDGPSTIKYGDGSNITNAFVWTCEGRVAYERENEFFETELVDYRYKFTNVETGNYLTWKNQDMWYLSGAGAPYYGAIKMQVNADNNLYRWLVIDMRDGSLNQANGDCTGNTYSNWYYFEEFEPIVSEWDGSEPVVTVADATTVKVTFTDAHAVEASNYGVLAAIYDESGDVYAIAFNDLFGDTVEFGKDCAVLHFKKISDLNAELADVAKAHASKVTAAVSGSDVKGKVVIASKSFKIDETSLYNKVIISDFDFNAGGELTGIEGIANDSNVKVYDLQGRRVAAPRQGFQIRNGVKVVK